MDTWRCAPRLIQTRVEGIEKKQVATDSVENSYPEGGQFGAQLHLFSSVNQLGRVCSLSSCPRVRMPLNG